MTGRPPLNKRVADKLLEDGRIEQGDHARVLEYARQRGKRVEEAIIELDLIEEVSLLKYIATMHQTQFVSTDKLSRARIDPDAVHAISFKLARHFGVFPLLLDRTNSKLVLATADPDNPEAEKEVRLAAQVEQVVPTIARPAAIDAAIARAYEGDRSLFKRLLSKREADFAEMLMPGPFDPMRAAGERADRRHRGRGRAAAGGAKAGRAAAREAALHKQEREPRDAARELGREAAREAAGPFGRARDEESEAPGARQAWPSHGAEPEAPAARPAQRRARRTDDEGPRAGIFQSAPPSDEPAPEAQRVPLNHGFGGAQPPVRARVGAAPELAAEPMPVADPTWRPAELARSPSPELSPAPARSPAPRQSSPHAAQSSHPPVAAAAGPASEPRRPGAPISGPGAPAIGALEDELFSPEDELRFDRMFDRMEEDASHTVPRADVGLLGGLRLGGGVASPAHVPQSSFGLGSLSQRRPLSIAPPDETVTVTTPFLETLRVLMGLLENERRELRGHSTLVARLVLGVCERIRLAREQTSALIAAAYLHDLGKMGDHHLTLLNVVSFDLFRESAHKLAAIPLQLMDSIGLHEHTLGAVRSMYEQYGGGGLPHGLQGKEIPIGARILAACDSYADLTRNATNPWGRLLAPEEAMALMREHAVAVFDPNVLEVLERVTCGELLLDQLMADRGVLMVDPDPEETLVLQLRLVENGFDVEVARSVAEARRALAARTFALVVSEIDLDEPDAGLHLRAEVARRHPQTGWVFLSSRISRMTAQRAFDLDADDFITKPVAPEILVAKLMQLVERRAARSAPRGVSGSLSEMSLADIVQVLFQGRKTCALHVGFGEHVGEVHFRDGRIVNALLGDATGEVAFYRMLALGDEGAFRVDPKFVPPPEERIHASPEHLLLEGMRLLDEGLVP